MITMEPSTLLPLEGLSEGYGLRDDALDQMLMTTGYREVTLQYRSAIKRVQDAFCSDMRVRIISMPFDEEEDPLWPHMAWMPLWSNRDTCVLVADPLHTPSRHDIDYRIPMGFAQHFTHTVEEYPYYMPANTPEMVLPQYLECHPIRLFPMYVLNPQIPHEVDDTDPTIFALTLETIIRLRTYIADQLLIERGYATGVTYQYTTLLYELPLPAYPEMVESPWSLSFLLMDMARAIITLDHTDYLTWPGLHNLIDNARSRLRDLDLLVGKLPPKSTFLKQFDELHQYCTSLHCSLLRVPTETNKFIFNLLEKAGIVQEDG
jgi:hypothetical protein